MTHWPTRHLRLAVVLCGVTATIGATTLDAQRAPSDPWLAKSARTKARVLQDPGGRVRLEYPEKDWLVVPAASRMLLTLAEKDAEASIFVEASELQQPLAPEQITDLFATIEVETIQRRDPKAAGFAQRIIDADGRRVVVVEFTRAGFQGLERVRQYSYPLGNVLYRVICTAPAARLEKYGPTFAHAAATFTVMGR